MQQQPLGHDFQYESAEKAKAKLNAQRDYIAKMPTDDPQRLAEEQVLDVLKRNASSARLNQSLSKDSTDRT